MIYEIIVCMSFLTSCDFLNYTKVYLINLNSCFVYETRGLSYILFLNSLNFLYCILTLFSPCFTTACMYVVYAFHYCVNCTHTSRFCLIMKKCRSMSTVVLILRCIIVYAKFRIPIISKVLVRFVLLVVPYEVY